MFADYKHNIMLATYEYIIMFPNYELLMHVFMPTANHAHHAGEKVGIVIGKKGAMIKSLMNEAERSGLKLELVSDKVAGGDAEVRISGLDDESIMALRLKVIEVMNSGEPASESGRRR